MVAVREQGPGLELKITRKIADAWRCVLTTHPDVFVPFVVDTGSTYCRGKGNYPVCSRRGLCVSKDKRCRLKIKLFFAPLSPRRDDGR